MAADQGTTIVLEVLQRAPAWVRTDLTSHDQALRQRAEEVLTALIASALTTAEDKTAS